jgi:MFS family permease
MAKDLVPVAALLLTTAILLVGQGLQGILLPVEAARHGFSTLEIGAMGSLYFTGFIAGSLLGPRLVARAGHIRTFAALATTASIVPLLMALVAQPDAWVALRGLTGFCFAGLFMTIESWLNERAENAARGRIFAAYSTINLVALMGGQLLLNIPDASGFARFMLSAILVSLAVVPVSMTRLPEPKPSPAAPLDLKGLFKISPVAVICALGIGAANAIFWSLAPVYAESLGQGFAAHFMTIAVLGAALAQIPLGRWSDQGDRRRVIVILCVVAALAGVILALAARQWLPVLLVLPAGFLFGASALSVWAIVVAHANDAAKPGQFVQLSSGLLLVYGIGAALSPVVTALIAGVGGFGGIFAVTAASHAAMAVYAIYRMGVRNVMPRGRFFASPRTSTNVFKLDPRALDPMAARDNGSPP